MSVDQGPGALSRRLRPAIVLSTTEDACTVYAQDQRQVLPYAPPFPGPRVERVLPGHLVAVARVAEGTELVVWRWFDAIVLDATGPSVSLWEPAHGTVLAERRTAEHPYRPGSRAYVSAGLSGADWWIAGPVVERAEDADVDLAEVDAFFTELGLWDNLR